MVYCAAASAAPATSTSALRHAGLIDFSLIMMYNNPPTVLLCVPRRLPVSPGPVRGLDPGPSVQFSSVHYIFSSQDKLADGRLYCRVARRARRAIGRVADRSRGWRCPAGTALSYAPWP